MKHSKGESGNSQTHPFTPSLTPSLTHTHTHTRSLAHATKQQQQHWTQDTAIGGALTWFKVAGRVHEHLAVWEARRIVDVPGGARNGVHLWWVVDRRRG